MSKLIADRINAEINEIKSKLSGLQPGDSINRPIGDWLLSEANIKQYLDRESKGSVRYVVFAHDCGHSIMRMSDNSDNAVFYSFSSKGRPSISGEPDILVKRLLNRYLTSDYEDVVNSAKGLTKEIKEAKIIPYAWLQRNTSTAKVFKNSIAGASEELKNTLDRLEKESVVMKVSTEIMFKKFGTRAAHYVIAVSEL